MLKTVGIGAEQKKQNMGYKMTYELVETLQEKDLNDTIIKIIARVNIHDDIHGIRAVNFILMDNELLDILKFPIIHYPLK